MDLDDGKQRQRGSVRYSRGMSRTAGPVVVLAGGVGAARFLDGLIRVMPEPEVFVVVNVGDDMEWCGLHIAPDIDTVLYTLSDQVNPETGWGLRDESFRALERAKSLGGPDWFTIGDQDLGLHLARTSRLAGGETLSEVTGDMARSFGLGCTVTPVTDGRLRTMVEIEDGEVAFQEYFVERGQRDEVQGLRFDGADVSEAAPGVHEAINGARSIIIAPSNPFLSIGPILAVPGVRDCLLTRSARVAAISPIVGGAAIKGPAARIMESLGHEVSALGVARLYADLADVFVVDEVDVGLAPSIEEETGMRCVVTPTIMRGPEEKQALARVTLAALST
jgi:LPPG:FO 2-phospho-L-lactate transferase